MSKQAGTNHVEPYLFFGGRCEEALAFYRDVLGAEVVFQMRYDESPDPVPEGMLASGFEKKIMHCTFRIGGSTIMASDGCNEADGGFHGVRLSVSLPTAADVERTFAALAEGGSVQMPPMKTFWSESFGMVTDRFGLGWMVTVHAENPAPVA